MSRKKIKFVAGSVVILGAVMALAISSFDETKAYYQTVPELKAMGARAEGRRVRVAGNVVPGTIVRREEEW
jgi:cytochrome c-type biogenesis protein CcmE